MADTKKQQAPEPAIEELTDAELMAIAGGATRAAAGFNGGLGTGLVSVQGSGYLGCQ